MKQYIDLVKRVLSSGELVETRNGGRLTVIGGQLRFPMADGLPLVTTRRTSYFSAAAELCWFLDGETNTKRLNDWGVRIWNDNADENGDLGPVYGKQWRDYGGSGVDQIADMIKQLRRTPASTRIVTIAWNPIDMHKMKLPPCHFGFQLTVVNGKLRLQASIRSSDVMLGLPFNIVSYATLLHLFARVSGYTAHELIIDLGHIHIYQPHIENALIQVEREPLSLPRLEIIGDVPGDLRELQPAQFRLDGYTSHPALKYQMIV